MMTAPSVPFDVPVFLREYEFSQDAIGKSGNSVFRLDAPGQPPLIAKIFDGSSKLAAAREYARLNWLCSAGIAAPQALNISNTKTSCWLIMECVPGCNAVASNDEPATKVSAVAEALIRLHALSTSTCHYDETLSVKIASARENILNGLVEEHDFDEDHRHMNAHQLFAELMSIKPTVEDIVVVHGDASLPNFILTDGRLSGVVDCGKIGLSDRYQDLAICCRSIRLNLGDEWVDPFLRAYGLVSLDNERLQFYRMLDEFF